MSLKQNPASIEVLFQKRRYLSCEVAEMRIELAKKEAELLKAEILLNDKWSAQGMLDPLPSV
jgi:hypothetical protein